jgi:CRP-like cAMP-binding protein
MSKSREHDHINNRILLALPASTLKRMRPALELLDMAKGQMIDHVDGAIRYMYFINRGLVSLVKTMKDGRAVEVGVVGIEGVTDPNALFGMEIAIIEAVVQIPGGAFRIRRDYLADVMATDRTLHDIMQKYARFAFGQLAQTAGCNRLHSLEERCCRWLLICQDNALSDSFPITHEFLATMLGVQRSGVSITASFLQKAGLIKYARGRVTIVNRAGLEDAACECYASTRAELDHLFLSQEKK